MSPVVCRPGAADGVGRRHPARLSIARSVPRTVQVGSSGGPRLHGARQGAALHNAPLSGKRLARAECRRCHQAMARPSEHCQASPGCLGSLDGPAQGNSVSADVGCAQQPFRSRAEGRRRVCSAWLQGDAEFGGGKQGCGVAGKLVACVRTSR